MGKKSPGKVFGENSAQGKSAWEKIARENVPRKKKCPGKKVCGQKSAQGNKSPKEKCMGKKSQEKVPEEKSALGKCPKKCPGKCPGKLPIKKSTRKKIARVKSARGK